MRFLYFGDRHYNITTPANRTDDYAESMKAKDLEIIDIGKKNKVSAFLQPGDFLDKHTLPLDFTSEVVKRWASVDVFDLLNKMTSKKRIDFDLFIQEYLRDMIHGKFTDIQEAKSKLESEFTEEDFQKEKALLDEQMKNYIPIIGLAGNHELYGNNINTLHKTMLGFMEKIGVMRFATKNNPYFFTTEDGLKIAITGTHYHLDIDTPEHIDDYVVEEKLGDIHIHMVHGYLTDKSKGDIFRHTLIDQIKHTKADLTITGHDHIGFPITEVDGKYFVNPGAIPRLSNDLKEINREVKVLLIDITKEHGLQLKEIPLKSANDGNLVLSRTKIMERKKKESRLEEFKKTVREAGVKKATDIVEIVRNIADNRHLPVGVKNRVVERISEKMATIKGNEDGVVKEAYAMKLILENFQSHEFTELDFSKGFNVFVGESKQGKTAVLRAFDWIYENKPAGKRIVRSGADYARATIHVSNGYVISRYIEAKRGGKNGYEITDPNTGEVEFHNTKILPEVQKLLGYSPLVIDKDLQFNLNFMKQGTGWFLIGDQFSAPQKAKIIGGIYGTQYADAVMREIDSETKQSNEKIKDVNASLIKTKERLKEFDYLPDLKTANEFIEAKLKEIQELQVKKGKIEKLLDKREVLARNMDENQEALDSLMELDKAYYLISQIKEQVIRRNQLEALLDKRDEIMYSLKHLYHSLHAVKDLDGVIEQFKETQALLSKRNDIEKVIVKREEMEKQLQLQIGVIQQTEQIERAKRLIGNLQKGFDKRNRIEQFILKYEDLVKNIVLENNLLIKTQQIEPASALLHHIRECLTQKRELELKVKRAEELEDKRAKTNELLQVLYVSIDKTKEIEETRSQFEWIKLVYKKREEMEQALLKREKNVQLIYQEEQIIQKANEQIHTDIQMYQELLETEGKCPVCFGTVDKVTINRIVHEFVH